MRGAGRIAALVTLAWCAAMPAQEPPGADIRGPAAFEALQKRLATRPRPSDEECLQLLEAFVRDQGGEPRSPQAQQAMLWIAGIQLQRLDLGKARSTFRLVAEAEGRVDPELRARALYGLHETLVAAGEPGQAQLLLQQIVRDYHDTQASGMARIALAHLQRDQPVEVDHRIPDLVYGPDADGKRVDNAQFARGPRLLVFWSVDHAPSVRRLQGLANAWRRCGQPASNLVAYALQDDVVTLQRLRDQRQWPFPVLPARGRGYLHPDWLRLGVRAVPSTFLVDADGKLLARDPTPDRLSTLLR